ncbi:MAG: GMC family oxidoreductase [Ignavibacteriota bacterium]
MPQKLKPVDVVVIGVGFMGAIMAKELAAEGLTVVGLERGKKRWTVPEFQAPDIHDELKYSIRKGMMQDVTREALTFRNNPNQEALPLRQWNAFLPGTGVGGSGVHWNGQTFRFGEADFIWRTRMSERYGKSFVDPSLTIQDWGVTYDELEPYFDKFEYLVGAGGKAGNLKGKMEPGGNPFESWRSREYPNPPMKEQYGGILFRKTAAEMGYHPFVQPSSNMTRPYTNTEGLHLNACNYCGFCERYACEHFAKATPQTVILPVLLKNPHFELRTESQVLRINLDSSKTRATGVTYTDATGREFEQPADMVILATFTLNNARMMLLSGIGKPYDPQTGAGVIGRNYAYQTTGDVFVFYDESVNINPFMAAGSSGTLIDDFNNDNFDHGPHGFIGGSYIMSSLTNGRPIEFHPTPPGTPDWGKEWKAAIRRHYNHTAHLLVHGSSMPTRTNYLDLDPTYKDAWGQPLLRMTFELPDNDVKMTQFCVDRAVEIGKKMGAKTVAGYPRKPPFTTQRYQTTHNTGGVTMGSDPSTSAINRYLQSWDVHNVFVPGASAYPQNSGYNPTDTLGALTYWSVDAIKKQYLKTPGPLVAA